jgi:hypothetical protein
VEEDEPPRVVRVRGKISGDAHGGLASRSNVEIRIELAREHMQRGQADRGCERRQLGGVAEGRGVVLKTAAKAIYQEEAFEPRAGETPMPPPAHGQGAAVRALLASARRRSAGNKTAQTSDVVCRSPARGPLAQVLPNTRRGEAARKDLDKVWEESGVLVEGRDRDWGAGVLGRRS